MATHNTLPNVWMVAVDGSPHSKLALKTALKLAKDGDKFIFLHVCKSESEKEAGEKLIADFQTEVKAFIEKHHVSRTVSCFSDSKLVFTCVIMCSL